MVTDVQDLVAQVGESERGDDVPDTEESNLRIGLDHLVGVRMTNAAFLQVVTEIQRRCRAAAEADDINRGVAAGPGATEMRVRLLDAGEFAQAKRPAEDTADDIEASTDAGDVEVGAWCGIGFVRLEEPRHVRVAIR